MGLFNLNENLIFMFGMADKCCYYGQNMQKVMCDVYVPYLFLLVEYIPKIVLHLDPGKKPLCFTWHHGMLHLDPAYKE